MAKRPQHPTQRMPFLAQLSTLAVPVGAGAIERTLAVATDALLRMIPVDLQRANLKDRLLTPARVIPVPQTELVARERADKPPDTIAMVGLVGTAGLPREQTEALVYTVRPATVAYANIFLDHPVLYLDAQLHQMFFSPDQGAREDAIATLGRAVIDITLAAAPEVRVLPRDPWLALVQRSVEQGLLPSLRQHLEAAGTYDEQRFATLTAHISRFFAKQPQPHPDTTASACTSTGATRERVNTMLNAYFGDNQPVDEVDWEPERQSRLIAHGAKVLFLLPGEALPAFEFGAGTEFDRQTRMAFSRQAVLAFYDRLQQHRRLPVVARHERDLRDGIMPLPQPYLEHRIERRSILEHYLTSAVPEWYLENLQRPGQQDRNAASYPH